jgi:S-adenosylmethionine decarboxylase
MKREGFSVYEVPSRVAPAPARTNWPEHHHISPDGVSDDHFVQREGRCFAGTHLILDFWGATHLDDLQLMESALRECVTNCRATLLHLHLHHFSPNGGISGVAVLAESHISVHTWPERSFGAFDIFMCGNARPEEAVPILKRAFSPRTMHISKYLRGEAGNA